MTFRDTESIVLMHYGMSRRKTFRTPCPWITRRGTRDNLGDVCREAGLNKCAEIGVERGGYSRTLCERNPNGEVNCIDTWGYPFDLAYPLAIEALKGHNAKIIRARSMTAVQRFADESLDFVYIDGDHRFKHAYRDIVHWSRKVRSGGIIACLDYCRRGTLQVYLAVDQYIKENRIKHWFVIPDRYPTALWVKP